MTMFRKVEKIFLKGEPGFSRVSFSYSKWHKTKENAWDAKIYRGFLGLRERVKKICVYIEDSDGVISHRSSSDKT